MGYQAIVYGRIAGAREASKGPDAPFPGSLHHHNQCVIQSLPDTDSDWPFLTRHMFSLATPKLESNVDRGIYRGQIIHFGAGLKVHPVDTQFVDQWLAKFEQQLLKQLVWLSATVHFEHETAGNCEFRYSTEPDSLRQVMDEFFLLGSRVEASLGWVRQPPGPNWDFA